MVYDSGWDPYADVLFSTKTYFSANQNTLRKFVAAYVKGLNYYKANYHAIDEYMHQFNNQTSVSIMDQAAKLQYPLIYGGDAATHGVAYMSAAKVEQTIAQMRTLGLVKGGVNLPAILTTSLLPGS